MGVESSDDAAVYRLDAEKAIISTVDVITPPVDDPWWFGQIAAANSISDVYAMGGRPLTALSLVMFPETLLDIGLLREILRGGNEKIMEAGASLCGGHTVDDEEPKYGLAVTGVVHPDRILRNNTPKPGDALVLTKPIGTGVLFNAARAGRLPYARLEGLLPLIASLNAKALEVALEFNINACTDITGFGIAGHALEMAQGSGTSITLDYKEIPVFEDAPDMYASGVTTGSNQANQSHCEPNMSIMGKLKSSERDMLFDPQTSGGLMLSLPEDEAGRLVTALKGGGVEHACVVGHVSATDKAPLIIS